MIPSANGTGSLKFRSLTLFNIALLTVLLVSPPSAQAQEMGWWFGNPSPYPRRAMTMHPHSLSKRSRDGDTTEKKAATAESKPVGPLFAILSLSDQHISVYNSSGLVTRSKVSTGMPGHRTPMGIFSIIGRERYHASNIYSGAPMPFMQRITWSGVAMHLGVVPGYPASHGCIRLPSGSAERLWGLTKIGERVVISPHEVAPASITHPMLPTPKLLPSPASVADAGPAKATEIAAAGNDPLPIGGPRLLNPLEYARALKARAAADVASATKAIQEANQRKDASPEARKALAELRAAETVRSQAEAKLSSRVEALATKRDARELQRAEAAKAAAEAALAEAVRKVQAALDNPAFASPEGRDALEAERKLMEVRSLASKAQATARDAERRLSPISILVSKKDNKVYVRQALAPILEAAVTIRDPQTPLGTHVYIATSSSDNSLGWTAVSYPIRPKVLSSQARCAGTRVGSHRPSPNARRPQRQPSPGARRTPGRGFGAHLRATVDRRVAHHHR